MRKKLLHLDLCLALCLGVITYIDNRNPMMGFLHSPVGYAYLFAFCLLTVVTCILNLCPERKKHAQNPSSEEQS